MTRKNISLLLLLSFLLALAAAAAAPKDPNEANAPLAAPPKTAVNEVKETVQGTVIIDPYRWLEDQNSPETRAWIDAQNAYSDGILSKLQGREAVRQQVSALIKIDSMGAPVVMNNRYFFTKRQAEQDQSSIFMRQGLTGKDELLIDPLPMSPRHTVTVNLSSVTRDGSLLAYSVREGGADEVTPRLFDVDARKDLADVFPKARYSGFSILNDKSGVYLTRDTADGPRVFFHKIGTETASDIEIFGKGYGPENIIGSGVTRDNRYLQIVVQHGPAADRSEIYVQDLAGKGPIVAIVKDVPAAFYGQIAGDRMYVRTNWKAPKWRVMEVDLKNPALDQWREAVPESDAVLEGMSLVGGKLAVRFTQNVIPHVKLLEPGGKLLRELPLPALGSISGINGQWDSSEAFFSFTSYHIPPTIYRYDVATGKQTVWSQLQVPIETDRYEVKQVWYTSKDGTKIPMFLAHAKNLKLDGKNPVLLTGYGGFNLAQAPGFNSLAAAWMANGGVYAVANLRGGGEFGEAWHQAGMMEKKQNVFDDFIVAAEWLIANNYTNTSRLAINGGSNGGLLVAACMVQRPDLFGAVVCEVPVIDMLRYHRFTVGRYWIPEYGDAEHNPDHFRFLYAYSPLHNIKEGVAYPPTLIMTADTDDRVVPAHAKKFTATLQAAHAGENPILLRLEMKAGHGMGKPTSKIIEARSDMLAFLFHVF